MKEINQKSIIVLFVIYTLIVGGYGVFKIISDKVEQKQTNSQNEEIYNDYLNTANAYITVGDNQKAAEQYAKAAKLKNNKPEILFKVACQQYNAHQYEEAENIFAKIENWGETYSDYWLMRTENMSNILTSIKNINKAKKYSQKMDGFVTNKEDVWLYLTTKAKIYLEEYKYYRIQRKNYTPITQEEIDAKETFLETLKDLETIAHNRKDSHIMNYRSDLWNQYITFPDFNYESKFDNLPELEKIPYTQEDIERIKLHRPQDDFPQK